MQLSTEGQEVRAEDHACGYGLTHPGKGDQGLQTEAPGTASRLLPIAPPEGRAKPPLPGLPTRVERARASKESSCSGTSSGTHSLGRFLGLKTGQSREYGCECQIRPGLRVGFERFPVFGDARKQFAIILHSTPDCLGQRYRSTFLWYYWPETVLPYQV